MIQTPAIEPLIQLGIMEILPEDKQKALKLLEQLIAVMVANSDDDLNTSFKRITDYYMENVSNDRTTTAD